jgi:hypothetical protein
VAERPQTLSRTSSAEERAAPRRSTGLLRAFWIALVIALVTTGHVYSFRLARPGRYPRDLIPHVAAGVVAIGLGLALARREARARPRGPRHVALLAGCLVALASGAGLAVVHRSGAGTVDLSSPPLELALALAHFAAMIVLLVGAFRVLRVDYLD